MRKWTLIAVASILLLATLMASGCTSYSATQPKCDVPALKEISLWWIFRDLGIVLIWLFSN
ncbi:hypothetical protein SPSIL_047880 [Sporomusa silvacetica DSM 10669]|uniref:Lipoprotein n=1 Tax=Sporomusa silvacetica DSM 10669 TaxID=1123289 RepID=A0ABZ3ISK3_9FIRM|nr:hypothetical protein SPSIL_47080 [Sporomusa silvacetica DSM 10669]